MATIAPEMDVSTVLLDVMFQVPKLIGAVGGKALYMFPQLYLLTKLEYDAYQCCKGIFA